VAILPSCRQTDRNPPGARSILRTCAKMVQNQKLDWMEPNGLYAHHDVWFARSWPGTRHLLSPPRETQGMDSASCVVALSSLGNRCFLLWLSHSTVPSFSRRITEVGKAYDHVDREIHNGYHHSTVHGFRFVPDGGNPINLETQIIFPYWNTPAIFDGQSSALCISTMIKGPSKTKR